MNDERKNRDAKGLWWKRFFYNVTGADYDYEVGPNWYASVILADPIFQGLAISLMFGEIASLLISRMAVPVLYYLVKKRRQPQPVRP